MRKRAVGAMRYMMVPNRKADMRFRKKVYLRNKVRVEADRQKKDHNEKSHPNCEKMDLEVTSDA